MDLSIVKETGIAARLLFNNGSLNPFQLLGFDSKPSIEEVRQRYIDLIKVFHPDVSKLKQAEELTKRLNDAYKHCLDSYSFNPDECSEAYSSANLFFSRKDNPDLEMKTKLFNLRKINLDLYLKELENLGKGSFDKELTAAVDSGQIVQYLSNANKYKRKDVIAGYYLEFDWGTRHYIGEGYQEFFDDYRRKVNLKHLFAYLELKDGSELNELLIEPLTNLMKLNQSQISVFIDELRANLNCDNPCEELCGTAEVILDKLGIHKKDYKKYSEECYYMQLLHNVMELIDPLSKPRINKDNLLILKGVDKDFVFTPENLHHFATLAYGSVFLK